MPTIPTLAAVVMVEWSELQWGTLGEWVSGAATFAAVVVTLYLVRHGRRRELTVMARQIEIVEPWQRRTDAWPEGREPPQLTAGQTVDWQMPIVNRSPEPIEWLRVSVPRG